MLNIDQASQMLHSNILGNMKITQNNSDLDCSANYRKGYTIFHYFIYNKIVKRQNKNNGNSKVCYELTQNRKFLNSDLKMVSLTEFRMNKGISFQILILLNKKER